MLILEFNIMHPNHTQFPVLPGQTPPLVSFLPAKKGGKKREQKNTNPICVVHIHTGEWSKSQWTALKIN